MTDKTREEEYDNEVSNEEFKKRNDFKNTVDDAALAYNSETMGRYADAATEYHKAYTGKNYQAQGLLKQDMHQSLKDINNYKVDPNNVEKSLKAHAGYSAEVMDVAERNAKAKINGLDDRYARADDVMGHKINETKNDVVHMDKYGNEIIGADGTVEGMQLKFVKIGQSADKTAGILVSSEFRDKYPDGNYCVAKDKYDDIIESLNNRETKLQGEIDRCSADGKISVAEDKQKELDYVKKVKANMVASEVTEDEALEATANGLRWTTGRIISASNQAGLQCAEVSAKIGFVTSLSKNLIDYMSGKVDQKTAVKNVAVETAKSAAGGYAVGFANTVISSAMQSSSNTAINTFASKCPDAPGYMATFAVQTLSVVGKRICGEISDEECFAQIGTNAAALAGSAVGKTIGSAFGPVGAMVGSFVGSVLVRTTIKALGFVFGDSSYRKNLEKYQKESYYEAKRNYERLCAELDEIDRVFRETYIANTDYLRQVMGSSVAGMAFALQMDDADSFIVSANNITHALGEDTQFNSVKEFKEMVNNRKPLSL